MFEVGWSEILVIAIVMIVVVGPKDLPGMLRSFGKFAAKARQMAGDFQKQFNDALQEAELDDVKKTVDDLRSLNPKTAIKKHLNPFEQAANDVRAGLQSMRDPTPKASTDAQPMEAPAPLMTETAPRPAAPATVPAAKAKPSAAKPKAAPKLSKTAAAPAKPAPAKASAKAASAKATKVKT